MSVADMEDQEYEVYGGETTFHRLQVFLGKRPGDYITDPNYLRKGMGNKPYFWDAINKKWRDIRIGDIFYFDNDGIAVQERPKK